MTDRSVAVFVAVHLPPSQTFIAEELRRHERYRPEVFARELAEPAPTSGYPVHVGGPGFGFTGFSRPFVRRLRDTNPSLIHAHFGTVAAQYALPYAIRFRLPLVVTFHGYDVALLADPRGATARHWPYLALRRLLFRRMTLALCVSQQLADELVRVGAPREKVRVHHLGIDLERFDPQPRPDGPARIAMVGRLVEKKGFADGLRAVAILRERGIAVECTVAGDGPLSGQLRDLAQELGLDDVRFVGALDHGEVVELLHRTDVVLVPSVIAADGDRDGMPTIVKEAAAAGAVPVGTNIGGIDEAIIDGVTGIVVEPHDPAGLAARLEELLADPSRLWSLAQRAVADARERFDSRTQGRELERLYDLALERAEGVA